MLRLKVTKKEKSMTPSFYLLCWPQKAKSRIRRRLLKNKRISPNFRSMPTFQTNFLIISIILPVDAIFSLPSTMIWHTRSIKPPDLEKIFQHYAAIVLAVRALSQSFCRENFLLRYFLQSTQKLIGSGLLIKLLLWKTREKRLWSVYRRKKKLISRCPTA